MSPRKRSLSELVGAFMRADARENALEDRRSECYFKARKAFPKRPEILTTTKNQPAGHRVSIDAAQINENFDFHADIFKGEGLRGGRSGGGRLAVSSSRRRPYGPASILHGPQGSCR